MRRIAALLGVLAAAAFVAGQAAAAPTCTTTAEDDGSWSAAGTWSNGVPAAGVDACVPSGRVVTWDSTMAGPGTTTVLDGGRLVVTGYATLSEGRVLEIEPLGRLELAADNRYVSRSGTVAPLIHNRGTIVRTVAGPNDADLRVPVDNDGTVAAEAGRLVLSNGGGESSGDYGSGAGTVELGGGVHTLGDGARLLGGVELTTGELAVAGGTATSSGANLVSAGTIAGPGTLSAESGTLTWSGGTMRGPGTTIVKSGATLRNTGYTTLADGRLLDNRGAFELAADNRYVSRSGTGAPLLRNTGTIRRTAAGAGDADLRVPVENDGLVVSDTGRLVLSNGGGESTGSYGGGPGTVELGGGVHTLSGGARLLGGTELTAGELSVAGGTAASSGDNLISAGTVSGSGGLSVDSGTLTWSGGTMRGPGTTTIQAGATLRNTGYTTLGEGRVLLNAGTLELPTDNRYMSRSGAAPVLRNTGTIRRTAGGGAGVDLRVPVENDGAIVSDGGTLELSNGGADGSSGRFGGGAGTVSLQAGTWQLDDGAELRAGSELDGATLSVPAGETASAAGATSMKAGTVTGAGALSIASGTWTWSGGTMGGSGTTRVAPGATLALPAQGSVFLAGTRVLEVAGLADLTANGGIGLSGAGAAPLLHVAAGGLLRKSGGTSWSTVSVPVRNDGTADGQAGRLMLMRGAAEPHTGLFKGRSATEHVVLDGQGHVLAGTARLEDHAEIAGDVSVREGDTLTLAGQASHTDGVLTGDVAVTGTLTWSGGSHDAPGTTTIAAPGRVVVETCGGADLGEGRRLHNLGRLELDGGAGLSGYGGERPEIRNAGRIELDSAADACGSYTGIVGDALVANEPAGTIEKLGGAGDSYVGNLDNDGLLLDSAPGDLRIDSSPAVGHAGTFRSTGAGAIAFDHGDFLLEPGAAVDGDVKVTGADVRPAKGMTLEVRAGDTLALEAGSIAGAGDVRVGGALAWTGGRQEGTGSTLVEPGATLSVVPAAGDETAYAALTASRSLVNRGAMTVEDARLDVTDGASIFNRGALELRGDSELGAYGFGDGHESLLHNTGVLRKTGASTIDARVPLDNDGAVEVQAGTLELEELVNWSGLGFVGEAGISGGEYLVRGTLVVPGQMTVNAGRLVLDGAASRVMRRTPGGGLGDAVATLARNAAGGEFVLRGGRSLTVANAFANHGVLDLGPGSTLNATGFRQAAGAVLRPAVTPGGLGRVSSPGTAELGGRIDSPATGPAGEHVVLSAADVRGAFAAVTGGYAVSTTATEVRLRAPGAAPRSAGTPQAPPAAPGAPQAAGAPAAPRASTGDALAVAGPWTRVRARLVAARRGARIAVPAVRGRALALVARTCRRCGSVRVRWAGRTRTASLAGRPGRRTIRVFSLRRARTGAVRITATSSRRVAVRALLVAR